MISNLPSFVCTASLILLYINILGLLFMSKSLISTTEWELPSSSILSQYYELRSRLFHSANYSCTFTQNKVVLVQQFTLSYSEFVFVSLVALLGGVYLIIKIIRYVATLFRELGLINVREKADCPICMEDLQTSRESTLWLSCLHAIHHKCYLELSKTSLKCPVCSKSFVEKSNLVDFNERIDAEIAATPMPEEYANMMVKILCNDCNNESEVKFHIFGLKCLSGECGSYNTRRI